MDLGNILREERKRQGISRLALAEAAGVTDRAIYYWESNKRKMNVDSADKVFKALHISIVIGEEG